MRTLLRRSRCVPGQFLWLTVIAAWAPFLAPIRDARGDDSETVFSLSAVCWDFKGGITKGNHPDFNVPDLAGAGLSGLYTAGLVHDKLTEHGNPKCRTAFVPPTGKQWDNYIQTSTDHVFAIDVPASLDSAVAVGGNIAASTGSVFKAPDSEDGAWPVVLTTTAALLDVDMIDEGTGWAVGMNGAVLKTIDGGLTWMPQFTDGLSLHFGVSAVDADTAYISASLGVLWKTIDGGATWTPISNAVTGTTSALMRVDFLDAMVGFVAGNDGTILKTNDGGATWVLSTPVAAHLRGIHIHDASTAWVAGDAGRILKTTDAGATWTLQNPGTAANLNAIDFSDDGLAGFVVGNGGLMRQTFDGGATWSPASIGIVANINDVVYLPAEGTGLAAANAGIIMHHLRTGTVVTTDWIHAAGPAEAREAFDAAAGDTTGTYNGPHKGHITAAESMEQWYLDVRGTNMSTTIKFPFHKAAAGYYLFSTVDFAPIDDLLLGNTPGEAHNYEFTVKGVWKFTYDEAEGQWFSYRGNDDCWIFVDGRLVLDMGGTHAPTMQFIDFDRLGLSDGDEYEMRIFMAKRRRTANLVQMATNVMLWSGDTLSISQTAD